MRPSVHDGLRERVGRDSLVPDEEVGRWAVGSRVPNAVVAPANEEELAEILTWCSEEGLKVVPAGLGTWLQGGEAPRHVDLVVTTSRMRDIREYEPADLTLTTGAGIPVSDLERATEANGQWLPLDPPGGRVGSLGALVSLGQGGPLRHRYGNPRDMVLGITMVSGRGEVLRWGGRVVKNVAGFDLTRLLTGSRGSLGVITSVSTRLFPLPERDVTLLWPSPARDDLVEPGMGLAQAPLPLAGVQLFDPCPVTEWTHGEWTDAGWTVVAARLLGSVAEVEDMSARAEAIFGRRAGRKLEDRESRTFHQTVNSGDTEGGLSLRMTVLPALVRGLVEEAVGIRALLEEDGSGSAVPRAPMVVDLEGGVLGMTLPEPAHGRGVRETWGQELTGLGRRLQAKGGSLTAGGGTFPPVRGGGGPGAADGESRLVEGLRLAFDPGRVFSAGRFGS